MAYERDYTEALQTELLTEMADSFFGERCAVEKQMEALQAKEPMLQELLHNACCALLRLEWLLGRQLLELLLAELEISVDNKLYMYAVPDDASDRGQVCEVDTTGLVLVKLARILPVRWLKQKAYGAIVCRAWKLFAAACERYMDGPELNVAEHGVKGRGLGYEGYMQRVMDINRKVHLVNVNHAPSCIIGMMESLDVGAQRQQKAAQHRVHLQAL